MPPTGPPRFFVSFPFRFRARINGRCLSSVPRRSATATSALVDLQAPSPAQLLPFHRSFRTFTGRRPLISLRRPAVATSTAGRRRRSWLSIYLKAPSFAGQLPPFRIDRSRTHSAPDHAGAPGCQSAGASLS